eukprot:PLAT15456.1.p1 GENE.PLAT15456.1~~PLAT15456.1.p1  ORF type:complete len:199 (+),score=100.83 PLAT15456.1:30-626(+)
MIRASAFNAAPAACLLRTGLLSGWRGLSSAASEAAGEESAEVAPAVAFVGGDADAADLRVSTKRKNALGSIYKFNRVAELVRGLPVRDAVAQMAFQKQWRALLVKQMIARATNLADIRHDLKPDELYVSEVLVTKGRILKFPFARAKGRVDLVRKRYSHVTVTVEPLPEGKAAASFARNQPVKASAKRAARRAAKRKA